MREKRFVTLYPVLYRVVQVILLAVIVMTGFNRYVGITALQKSHGIFAVVALALLAFINYGKWNEKLISVVVFLLLILFVVPLIGVGQMSDFWQNYCNWLLARPEYKPEYLFGYEWMQTIWIVCGCYGFEILLEKRSVFRDVFVLCLLIVLIACMLMSVELTHVGVVFMIGFIVIYYMEKNQQKWKMKNRKKGYIIWLLPFCILYIFLLYKMPVQKEPYDWEIVRNAYAYVKEKVIVCIENIKRNDKEDFAVSMSGFSESGKLRGGISNSEKELITIERQSGHDNNIYLRGKTYDSFSGRGWEQSANLEVAIKDMDMLEMFYALKRYDNQNLRSYIDYNRLKLRYEYFNTGILFIPAKIRIIEHADYMRKGNDYIFGEQKGYGTEYKLTFYQLNQKYPDFVKLLETDLQENEEIWEHVVNTYLSGTKEKYTLAELKAYQQQMKDIYSGEVELSEDVKEYVEEITAGCETDIQRLQAIEYALAGYEYTKTPGELPDTVTDAESFLEYLLLNSKRGYCSHYATAFVLLARSEGFPARYVEGFCVPATREDVMIATGTMLHAWPEVYVEGVGWISFEPTPGYGTVRYNSWSWVEKQDYVNSNSYWDYEEEMSDSSVEDNDVIEEDKEKKERFKTIAVIVIEIMMVCAIICLIEFWFMRRRYQRKSIDQKFLAHVKRNMWIWSRLGYGRKDAETLEELQERIIQGFPVWMEERTEWIFLKGYQEYLYRSEVVSQKLLEQTIAESAFLLEWLKKERKWQYLIVKLRSAVQWGI